jgi:hypothetical protein
MRMGMRRDLVLPAVEEGLDKAEVEDWVEP